MKQGPIRIAAAPSELRLPSLARPIGTFFGDWPCQMGHKKQKINWVFLNSFGIPSV
jgi:hypothetical protein